MMVTFVEKDWVDINFSRGSQLICWRWMGCQLNLDSRYCLSGICWWKMKNGIDIDSCITWLLWRGVMLDGGNGGFSGVCWRVAACLARVSI